MDQRVEEHGSCLETFLCKNHQMEKKKSTMCHGHGMQSMQRAPRVHHTLTRLMGVSVSDCHLRSCEKSVRTSVDTRS